METAETPSNEGSLVVAIVWLLGLALAVLVLAGWLLGGWLLAWHMGAFVKHRASIWATTTFLVWGWSVAVVVLLLLGPDRVKKYLCDWKE